MHKENTIFVLFCNEGFPTREFGLNLMHNPLHVCAMSELIIEIIKVKFPNYSVLLSRVIYQNTQLAVRSPVTLTIVLIMSKILSTEINNKIPTGGNANRYEYCRQDNYASSRYSRGSNRS